jgi:hypothetical protein
MNGLYEKFRIYIKLLAKAHQQIPTCEMAELDNEMRILIMRWQSVKLGCQAQRMRCSKNKDVSLVHALL